VRKRRKINSLIEIKRLEKMGYCKKAKKWAKNTKINVCENRTCKECREWEKQWEDERNK